MIEERRCAGNIELGVISKTVKLMSEIYRKSCQVGGNIWGRREAPGQSPGAQPKVWLKVLT